MLFLIAFNPILQAVYKHPARGYSLTIEKEHQVSSQIVPMVDSFVYALWDGESTEEKYGWYLAKIISISAEGKVTLLYRSGGCSEETYLSNIK